MHLNGNQSRGIGISQAQESAPRDRDFAVSRVRSQHPESRIQHPASSIPHPPSLILFVLLLLILAPGCKKSTPAEQTAAPSSTIHHPSSSALAARIHWLGKKRL